jgi:hypothetical protein
MSTEMTLFGGKQLPAHLRGLDMDAVTKALVGTGATGRRISIKGAVFRMIVDSKQVAENEDRAMNVVVVAAAPSINRQFYKGTYQEGVAEAPDCYSEDGKTPAADSKAKQHSTCDNCPQNIAGSGQGDSRACRYQQRLAVVLEGEIGGPVYQLALPATSLFGKGEPNGKKLPLQAYAKHLASNGVPITAVVTEMRFDTASATPKLTFAPIRPLDEEEYQTSLEQGASADAQQAIKLSVFQTDGGKPVTKATPAPKASAKQVPVPDAEVEQPAPAGEGEGEAEPVKVTKAKPEAPAGKRPVSAVMAEWDE